MSLGAVRLRSQTAAELLSCNLIKFGLNPETHFGVCADSKSCKKRLY